MDKELEIFVNSYKKIGYYGVLSKELIMKIDNLMQENKELKEITKAYNSILIPDDEKKYNVVFADIRYFNKGYFKENFLDIYYICKDKIKEKIQKLEKYYNIMKKTYPRSLNINYVKEQIKILEELLEETNND